MLYKAIKKQGIGIMRNIIVTAICIVVIIVTVVAITYVDDRETYKFNKQDAIIQEDNM